MITKIWHQTSTNVQLLQKEDYETNNRNSSTTCTNAIIHLFDPPKICIGIVFYFPLDVFMSQENLQTMIIQNFRGVKEVYYGIVRVVNSWFAPKVRAATLVNRTTTNKVFWEFDSIVMHFCRCLFHVQERGQSP